MNTHIVLTVIGPDRPGIVKDLSETLAAHHGNWDQSNMSTLAGQFAGILLATVPDEHAGDCLAALAELNSVGLTVITHATKDPGQAEAAHEFTIEVVGNDVKGIIRDITAVLKTHHVSIDDLDTRVESASMAGGTIFRASARLLVPDSTDLDQLQSDIEDIAGDLMVDIQMEQ